MKCFHALLIVFPAAVLPILHVDAPVSTASQIGPAELGEALIREARIPGGVCVVMGRPDANLALDVSNRGRFVVHALCNDNAALEKARKQIDSAGLYGRVSADLASCDRLGYAENLVNIVIADGYPALKYLFTIHSASTRDLTPPLPPSGAYSPHLRAPTTP